MVRDDPCHLAWQGSWHKGRRAPFPLLSPVHFPSPVNGFTEMLILFDIDDTLLDHTTAMRAAAAFVHQQFGGADTFEQFFANWSAAQARHYPRFLSGEISYAGQRPARVREMIDLQLTDAAADEVFADYFAAYEANWSLFPDVRECLAQLSRHRLGVISNGASSEQRRKLVNTGIAEYFEHILISDECGWFKPAPEIFRHACSLCGESAANAVYVGNLYDLDAEAARRAGLRGVWLDRDGRRSPHNLPPIITRLNDLPKLID
jgi:putative hydrolase of the HAD superfamily